MTNYLKFCEEEMRAGGSAYDKNRLIVTGANGFVGRALCVEASARGIEVLGAIRHHGHRLPIGVQSIAVGDIDDNTGWQNVLVGCDVVIHLAARVHVMQEYSEDALAEFRRVNVGGTERLARSAVAAGVKRLVYVSSVKVNGEETALGRAYTEQDAPAPQDPYGISKWEAEQALHRVAIETGLEVETWCTTAFCIGAQ
jgi:nucleoside-diphosphate-sugar epimerase